MTTIAKSNFLKLFGVTTAILLAVSNVNASDSSPSSTSSSKTIGARELLLSSVGTYDGKTKQSRKRNRGENCAVAVQLDNNLTETLKVLVIMPKESPEYVKPAFIDLNEIYKLRTPNIRDGVSYVAKTYTDHLSGQGRTELNFTKEGKLESAYFTYQLLWMKQTDKCFQLLPAESSPELE